MDMYEDELVSLLHEQSQEIHQQQQRERNLYKNTYINCSSTSPSSFSGFTMQRQALMMGDPGYDGREEFCYGQQEQEQEEESIFSNPSLNLQDFSSYDDNGELYKNSCSSSTYGQQEEQREEETIINPYVNLHQFMQQQQELHPEDLFLDHPLMFGDKGDSEPSSLLTEPSSCVVHDKGGGHSEQELVECMRRRSIRQGKQKCVDSAPLTGSKTVNLGTRKADDVELGGFASYLEMEPSSEEVDDELGGFAAQLEANLSSNEDEVGESTKVQSGPGESSLVGSSRSSRKRSPGGKKKFKRSPGYNSNEEYERAREVARAMVKEYAECECKFCHERVVAKFCEFNNGVLSQPRYRCPLKGCRFRCDGDPIRRRSPNKTYRGMPLQKKQKNNYTAEARI